MPFTRTLALQALLWSLVGCLFILSFQGFFRALYRGWLEMPEFSYGMLVPLTCAYLIWRRFSENSPEPSKGWSVGWYLLTAGCGLQILGSRSGSLIVSALGLVSTLAGATAVLFGRKVLKSCAAPLALLIAMVPLPSIIVSEISWRLQYLATELSADVLDSAGVPTYWDGTSIHLANKILQVEPACSGSRSLFALVFIALVLGVTREDKWLNRSIIMAVAPLLAICANILRIVGTGLETDALAANESVHVAWGVVIFLFSVGSLFGIQNLLRRATCKTG